jgi:non-canonical poly(A) RNA polymerase PAPD5/7
VLEEGSEERSKYEYFRKTDMYKNYKFEIDELTRIKIDLTFIELNKKQLPSTQSNLESVRGMLQLYPEIKPIIHVLKRYLQMKKLNSSFNGGLSSFSLFLLIVAYLKYSKAKTRMNLGRILVEMLELYGKCFNFSQTITDINQFK